MFVIGWKFPKVLVFNVKLTGENVYCAYCSSFVGNVADDFILLFRLSVIPYFHDTLLRSCGLHRDYVDDHPHFYELTVRPALLSKRSEKLVVRVLDSRLYGQGNVCSSFDERKFVGQRRVYRRFDDCEPVTVSKGLTLAPSITSSMVIFVLNILQSCTVQFNKILIFCSYLCMKVRIIPKNRNWLTVFPELVKGTLLILLVLLLKL